MRIVAGVLMVGGVLACTAGFMLIRWETVLIFLGVLALLASIDLSRQIGRSE